MKCSIEYFKSYEMCRIKNSHYSQILHGYMNTRSGRAKVRFILILLDRVRISTIVMGKITSKLKGKNQQKLLHGKINQGNSRPARI